MNIEDMYVALDDLISSDKIERLDSARGSLLSLVANDSSAASELLDKIDYGQDRAKDISQFDTSVKTQDSPQCSAYATVGAVENRLGGGVDISEPSLWLQYHIYETERAIECAHDNWLRTDDEAKKQLPGSVRLHSFTDLADDFGRFMDAIDSGRACVVAMSVPKQLAAGAAQVEDGSPMEYHGVFHRSLAGHAVVGVGYKIENGKPYFYIKNSWGVGA